MHFNKLKKFYYVIINGSMANRNLINLLSTSMKKRNKKNFLLYGSFSIAGGDSLIK